MRLHSEEVRRILSVDQDLKAEILTKEQERKELEEKSSDEQKLINTPGFRAPCHDCRCIARYGWRRSHEGLGRRNSNGLENGRCLENDLP